MFPFHVPQPPSQVLLAGHAGDCGGLPGASSLAAERLLQPAAMCSAPLGGAAPGVGTRVVDGEKRLGGKAEGLKNI